jgi:hypothetical protein
VHPSRDLPEKPHTSTTQFWVNNTTGEEPPPQLLKASKSRLERPPPEFPPTARQLLRIRCSERDRPSTWDYRAPEAHQSSDALFHLSTLHSNQEEIILEKAGCSQCNVLQF